MKPNYNSKENGIVIFCCLINSDAMCKTEIVYIDETFTYCVLNGHYVPLCFCALKDIHVSTYSECFKNINKICSSYYFVFEPKKIDFEKAIGTQHMRFNLTKCEIDGLHLLHYRRSIISPNIWANCSAGLNLTTNACESFHSNLAQSFDFS
ncbi:MULE domain-containing protein [Aphis craccivora]|uniref:MULE domain-containing protein n=1 Tax=Aphis craccivora TaxID=307492 RepID=A0A6G0YKB5_APHCR|nr:MULE domain-containing protein [Aphis craccivora]